MDTRASLSIAGLMLAAGGVVLCNHGRNIGAFAVDPILSTDSELGRVAAVEADMGRLRLMPPPPRFPPPKLKARRFAATRSMIDAEYLDTMLQPPAEDYAGNVPAGVADVPAAVLAHIENHAELDSWLKLTAAIGRCAPAGVRGAVLVDFLYDDGKPSGVALEGSTMPPQGDAALEACIGVAFAASSPRDMQGSVVVPQVVQFPIKNTTVFRYLEGLGK